MPSRLRLSRLRAALTVSVFLALLVVPAAAGAAPGDSDTTWGTGGVRSINANGMAIQPDGKVIAVVGDSVLRYTADGAIDTTFAGYTDPDRVSFTDVALHPDGRVVAVGTDRSASVLKAVRLGADGTADATFGRGGTLTFDFGDRRPASGEGVAVAPDGGVLLAGTHRDECNEFGSCQNSIGVVRVDPDGDVDPAFGDTGSGWTTVDVHDNDAARAITVDPGGNVLVAGQATISGVNTDGVLVRLDATGTPDPGFGSAGIVFGGQENGMFSDVHVDGDGRILVAGDGRAAGQMQIVVGRFAADGTPDASFGGSGMAASGATKGARSYGGSELAVQSDGKVLTSGTWNTNGSADPDVAVLRFGADGSPDTTFGTGGLRVHDLGREDTVKAMGLQPGGRLLVASDHFPPVGWDREPAMSAYLTGAPAPPPPPPPPVPTVSVSGTAVDEGDSGTLPASFDVTLSAPTDCAVTVAYATSDGTATAGSDYAAASGTATIPAGSTSTTVPVGVHGDGTVEPDEELSLTLSNPSCATLGTASATATIRNDDAAPRIVGVTPADGATRVSADTLVTATFDRAVTSRSLTLEDARGRAVRGALSCDSPCTTVTLDPKRLSYGATYTARVTGSNASGTDTRTWSFTVAPRR